MNKLGNLSSF